MTPIERIDAVLAGRRPDRPPFSFWHHFGPHQVAGEAALQAHLAHAEKYGLDFLKVMNDNPYPHAGRIESVDDLASLAVLRGDEMGFGMQLELLKSLKAKAQGRLYLVTTIFNAWAVLRQLIKPPPTHQPPNLNNAAEDAPSRWIKQTYHSHPERVTGALETIAGNLGRFATRCVQAGADGIFLSCRDDWLDTPDIAPAGQGLYARLVRPADVMILRAVEGAKFNILHVCGRPVHLDAFMEYPVPAINWADRAAGPAIEAAPRRRQGPQPVLCGGVDNLSTLPNGKPADVARQVADAIRQAGDRPLIVAPGCTYDPHRVPPENLRALAEAVNVGGLSGS